MNNIMTIDSCKAVIQYDPEIEMFRGEFIGLNGSADFYAADISGLKREGEISLRVFLDACVEDGVEPYKTYSGKFNVRISPQLHAEMVAAAAASGSSLNELVGTALSEYTRHAA